jgi:phage shock protein PspC (stress-responsive transcriptional regulator)
MQRKLLGVCYWTAMKFNTDVRLLRICLIIVSIISFGTPVLVYCGLFLALRMRLID